MVFIIFIEELNNKESSWSPTLMVVKLRIT